MERFLGIDIGTSSCKVLLMDTHGVVTDTHSQPYTFLQPKTGWAEQSPTVWVQALTTCIKNILHRQPPTVKIICIGVSGQMHGLTVLDKNGAVLRSAILWNDQRNVQQCREIIQLAGGDCELRRMTNNPMLVGFTAGKIRWLQQNEPDVYAKTAHILNPKDYIRYCLTGVYATEVSDASGTGVFDVKNRCWSEELLDKIGIDKNILPPCYESTYISGYVNAQGADMFGLPKNTPVVGGGGDAVIQTLGSGVYKSGMGQTTIGTAGICATIGDKPLINTQGRVQVSCNVLPHSWHYMGVSLNAGSALSWWRSILAHTISDISYSDIIKMAKTAPIGCKGVMFLPYLMGERCPHADAHSRGGFIGLRLDNTIHHMCRAVMEGITYSLRDMMCLMGENTDIKNRVIYASGGGTKSHFWNQMQADIFGCDVAIVKNAEHGGALGAAMIAAIGLGYWTVDKIDTVCTQKQLWTPQLENTQRYALYFDIYQQLYDTLQTVNHRLSQLEQR